MREHQIVITLKPEHFLEIQRLARAAGARSMGTFVRQRLVRALGIDGSNKNMEGERGPAGTSEERARVERLASDLNRIHGELKSFVAETLSQSYRTEAGDRCPADSRQPQAAFRASEDFARQDGDRGKAEAVDEVAASRTDDPRALFEQAKNELEQLAQSAFAISPRLGALESPVERKDVGADELSGELLAEETDPLEDLLDTSLAEQGQAEDKVFPSQAQQNAVGAETAEDDDTDVVGVEFGSRSSDTAGQAAGDEHEPSVFDAGLQGDSSQLTGDSRAPRRHRGSGGPPPKRRKT